MTDWNSIFKAYDVRGRTADELTPDVARAIGAAFARFADGQEIAVGRDCRLSSPSLVGGFLDGALSAGADVIDLGEVPTDVVWYYSGAEQVAGAMITASHNPPEWNGIKLSLSGAIPVGIESGLADIRDRAAAGPSAAGTSGSVRTVDPIPAFVDHLLTVVPATGIGPLAVVADGGNGMAGTVLPSLFDRLEARLTGLFLEPDGTFPNHHPDPLKPENLTDLLGAMPGADVGVAFDGDADRAFFVDNLAVPLSGSTTTALIARWFLERFPGASVVHNLITSRAVPEAVEAAGGTAVRTRVGHSFIKQVMAETGAVFGGEHSGHYYFRDNFRADSGMMAMLVLLTVVTELGESLAELRRQVEPYAQSGELNFVVDDQTATMDKVAVAFKGVEQDLLDGLTVSWADRWFNVRPSNTEPVLRVNVEAPDAGAVAELVAEVKEAMGV